MSWQGTGQGVGWGERIVALLGLLLSSPVTLAAAAALKATSRGPVLFRAQRVGRSRTVFTMYKLRTMGVDADAAGVITGGRDPRVTRIGRVLRSLKIDEVPQLINVVRGEMSFFGPRPEAISVVEEHYEPWMQETLQVAPGIVGPGSLGYFAEEDALPNDPVEAERYYISTLLPRKLARDLVFIRQRTTTYKIELLLRTGLGVLRLRGLTERAVSREEREASAILARTIEVTDEQPSTTSRSDNQ